MTSEESEEIWHILPKCIHGNEYQFNPQSSETIRLKNTERGYVPLSQVDLEQIVKLMNDSIAKE